MFATTDDGSILECIPSLWYFRMVTAECVKYHDIPNRTESRFGIVFRYQDHRHFIFFSYGGIKVLDSLSA